MKPLLLSFGLCLFFALQVSAQAPQKFNYQAVPRLANGSLLPGQSIKVRFVITEDGSNTVRYAEEQTLSTSQHGVLSAVVGEGATTGGMPHNFAAIDWAQHQYFLGVLLDLNGNGVFDADENFSSSQLLSVPYAFYAQQSGSGTDNDTDPTNEFQQLSLSGNTISLSNGGGSVTIPDMSPTNEIQQITLSGNVITLSNGGGSITLPPGSGTDAQTLSLAGANLSISNGNSVTLPDASATNELQTLSINGNTVSLTNGGSITLPPDQDTDAQNLSLTGANLSISNGNSVTLPDASATNELQNLSINGNIISLSNGGSVTLPPVQDTDAQNLSLTGANLSISNGNSVTLPDASATNELQTLSINGNVISLSNGGSITLPPNQGTDAQTLSIANNELSISNGNTITLPAEVDGSVTNELQQLGFSNGAITLTNGGSVALPDASATNELQTLSINGNTLSISNGNAVTLPPDQDTDAQNLSIAGGNLSISNGNTVALPDASATNELQTLSISGNTISLTDGGSVSLPPDQDTDAQTLAINGNTLSISNGNSVTLPSTGGGNTVVGGAGIDVTTLLNTSTVSARMNDPLWNASMLRGRPIDGMAPNPGYIMAYKNDTDGWVSYSNDFSIVGNNLQVSALRGRPIDGMPPNPGFIMAYKNDTDGWVSYDNDLSINNDRLQVSKIQGLNVNMSNIGPGKALMCTDVGNGVFEFQCQDVGGGGGGGLPLNYTGNSSTPLISITNTNTGTFSTVNVSAGTRYGISGTTSKGDALPIPFDSYENRTFTYPAGVSGINTNSSQEGAGVYGKSISPLGAGGSGVGLGGFFQGGWVGAAGIGYEDGHAGLVGIKKAKIADANWPKEQQWGVYGESTHDTYAYAGYFVGDVKVTDDLVVEGSVVKASGTFRIDHPQDPANKYLFHSFVESPDMKNIYDGVVTTDENGFATVELPGYFEVLNKDFRYQLTCIGTFAQAIISQKVENNRFQIQTDKPGVEVSWQVTGIRKDPYAEAHRVQPEVEKTGYEKGKYIHPELYGQPESMKIAKKAERVDRGE